MPAQLLLMDRSRIDHSRLALAGLRPRQGTRKMEGNRPKSRRLRIRGELDRQMGDGTTRECPPFADADPDADPDLYMIKVPFVDVFVTFLVGSDIREQRIVVKEIES